MTKREELGRVACIASTTDEGIGWCRGSDCECWNRKALPVVDAILEAMMEPSEEMHIQGEMAIFGIGTIPEATKRAIIKPIWQAMLKAAKEE